MVTALLWGFVLGAIAGHFTVVLFYFITKVFFDDGTKS